MTYKVMKTIIKALKMYLEEDLSYTASYLHKWHKLPEGYKGCKELRYYLEQNDLLMPGMTEEEIDTAARMLDRKIRTIDERLMLLYEVEPDSNS